MFLPQTSWAQSENEFFRELARKPVATHEDVMRSVARFKGYRGREDAAAEVAYLSEVGLPVPRGIMRKIRQPATKGDAARMFLNAMDSAADKRGLFGRFFTRSRRLAARDAMAQKILPSESYANEFIGGGELLSMLGRAVEQTGKKP